MQNQQEKGTFRKGNVVFRKSGQNNVRIEFEDNSHEPIEINQKEWTELQKSLGLGGETPYSSL